MNITLPLIDVPARNCKQLYDSMKYGDAYDKSGIYTINPHDGKGQITVFCDMTLNLNGKRGWMVIQRRVDDTTSFNRTQSEYQSGFGTLTGNFWLGLGDIRRVITQCATTGHELYIGMGSFVGDVGSDSVGGLWSNFAIGSSPNWELSISTDVEDFETFGENIGNSLKLANGKKFSTRDDDNDMVDSVNCANKYHGGWWYTGQLCHEANPNGYYYPSSSNQVGDRSGIFYKGWINNDHHSLRNIVMAIRPKDL